MPFATLLSIKVDDVEILTSYAARDLTAELSPISQAEQMERTLNGELLDMSMPQFRKRQMTVSCTDHESLGLSQFPPGTECEVICLPHLGAVAALTMTMMMGSWRESRREWAAETSWSLPLIEK